MKNVKMAVKDNVLTITVDLTKEFGDSKSGKTVVVASTEGTVKLAEKPGIIIGLNVNAKK